MRAFVGVYFGFCMHAARDDGRRMQVSSTIMTSVGVGGELNLIGFLWYKENWKEEALCACRGLIEASNISLCQCIRKNSKYRWINFSEYVISVYMFTLPGVVESDRKQKYVQGVHKFLWHLHVVIFSWIIIIILVAGDEKFSLSSFFLFAFSLILNCMLKESSESSGKTWNARV